MRFFLTLLSLFYLPQAFSQGCDSNQGLKQLKNQITCHDFTEYQRSFEASDGRLIGVTERIMNSDSLHSFYRSFPNFFYFLMDKHNILQDLQDNFQGYISGDPHIENFGAFGFKEKGTKVSKLSMNDFDDGGKGPLTADIIRYLGSVNIYRTEEDTALSKRKIKELISAYTDTIKNEGDFNPSTPTQEVLEKSLRDIDDKLKDVDYETGKFKDQSLSKCSERIAVHRAYLSTQKGETSDCYQRVKNNGGSAGLLRQYYFTKNPQQVVEIKTLPDVPASAIMESERMSSKAYSERTAELMKLSLGEDFEGKVYTNISLKNRNYLMRIHTEAFKKLRPNKMKKGEYKLSEDERWSVMKDQMKILAKLHSHSLKDSDKRKNYIKKIESADIVSEVNKIQNIFKGYYQACKKGLSN